MESKLTLFTHDVNDRRRIDEFRDKMRYHLPGETDIQIRAELHIIGKLTYKPKLTDGDYLDFIEQNRHSFRVTNPQSAGIPYYFTLFSDVGHFTHGDCLRECIDEAIEVMNSKTPP